MMLLKIIKKFLKIYNSNLLLAEMNFVSIKFDNDSDLKEENITYQFISAEAFTARIDVYQKKKSAAYLDVIDLI
jgi:hypothetical protein